MKIELALPMPPLLVIEIPGRSDNSRSKLAYWRPSIAVRSTTLTDARALSKGSARRLAVTMTSSSSAAVRSPDSAMADDTLKIESSAQQWATNARFKEDMDQSPEGAFPRPVVVDDRARKGQETGGPMTGRPAPVCPPQPGMMSRPVSGLMG